MNNQKITVTSPLLPPLNDFIHLLKDIWERKWLTNNGHYHQELEKALAIYLDVPYLSLFTNGTLPLITALQALKIQGEVITTPYSFVATAHSIWWNGLTPVFIDIDPETGNMNPDKIEGAITKQTSAIMPVHVYGTPCNTKYIQKIANQYDLRVIYDAAHAFGVRENGQSILREGNISTLSFHATKVYNTIEGGALICQSAEMKQKIDYLKNFGFANETKVLAPGINSKMDEVRAAYGLLSLQHVDAAINKRAKIVHYYREQLSSIAGITFLKEISTPQQGDSFRNHSYFPIFIDEQVYGINRDELYEKMKSQNILGRRYFYPLISNFNPYSSLPSSNPKNLPIAHKLANSVICLPLHHELSSNDVERVVHCIVSCYRKN